MILPYIMITLGWTFWGVGVALDLPAFNWPAITFFTLGPLTALTEYVRNR